MVQRTASVSAALVSANSSLQTSEWHTRRGGCWSKGAVRSTSRHNGSVHIKHKTQAETQMHGGERMPQRSICCTPTPSHSVDGKGGKEHAQGGGGKTRSICCMCVCVCVCVCVQWGRHLASFAASRSLFISATSSRCRCSCAWRSWFSCHASRSRHMCMAHSGP